jgi:hypothetical protein
MSQAKIEEIIENIPKKAEELNLSDEKFLFFFEPHIVGEEKFLAICPIETGMIIFSVIIIIQALGNFFDIFKPDSFMGFLMYAILFILYGVAAFYVCFGYIKKNYLYLKVGYIIISAVFILYAVVYVFKSIYKIFKFIIPFSGDFLSFNFVEYVFGNGVFLFGYLYLIYILYLYMIKQKKGNNEPKGENQNMEDSAKISINDGFKDE